MKLFNGLLCSILGTLLASACAPKNMGGGTPYQPLKFLSLTPTAVPEAATLKITDNKNVPIPGAQVLIGDKLNSPFSGNFLTTDSSGSLTIPSGWSKAVSVTVQASGFRRLTVFNLAPGSMTLRLKPLLKLKELETKGLTTQYGTLPSDGFAHFSIVTPTFERAELIESGVESMVSTSPDILDIFGKKIALPSNFALPRQKQNYSFITITLDKPSYRWIFDREGSYQLSALRGKFPFKKVVDALQAGQKMTDVFNDFSFLGAGIRDVSVQVTGAKMDIPVNEIQINTPVNVRAPSLASDDTMIAAALSSRNNRYFPSDMKILKSGETLAVRMQQSESNPLILAAKSKGTIAKKINSLMGDQLYSDVDATTSHAVAAAVYSSTGAGVNVELLPYFEDLKFDGSTITMTPPSANVALVGSNTMGVMQEVTLIQNELGKFEKINPKWDFVAMGWVADMAPPVWPNDSLGKVNRIEISFVGQQNGATDLTHNTRNSVDF